MYSLDIWRNTKINKCTSDRILVLSVTPPLPCWYFSLACLGEGRGRNIRKYFNQVQNFYENVSFQRNNAKCEYLLYFYELSYNINIKHVIQNIQLAIAAAQYYKNTLKSKIDYLTQKCLCRTIFLNQMLQLIVNILFSTANLFQSSADFIMKLVKIAL